DYSTPRAADLAWLRRSLLFRTGALGSAPEEVANGRPTRPPWASALRSSPRGADAPVVGRGPLGGVRLRPSYEDLGPRDVVTDKGRRLRPGAMLPVRTRIRGGRGGSQRPDSAPPVDDPAAALQPPDREVVRGVGPAVLGLPPLSRPRPPGHGRSPSLPHPPGGAAAGQRFHPEPGFQRPSLPVPTGARAEGGRARRHSSRQERGSAAGRPEPARGTGPARPAARAPVADRIPDVR